MDRVFLDANVLFSVAYREESGLLHLWSLRGAQLLTSAYALEEARLNLDDREQRLRLEKLATKVSLVGESLGPQLPTTIKLPAKDKPILLAAIAARATHLLTGDSRHFGVLYGRKVQGVLVLPPSQYLRSKSPA